MMYSSTDDGTHIPWIIWAQVYNFCIQNKLVDFITTVVSAALKASAADFPQPMSGIPGMRKEIPN